MTNPVDITGLVPKKWKPVIGLIGSFLTFVVPYVISAESSLPPVWTVVIGVVLALLTALGIYHAPYTPDGTVLAPDTPEVAAASLQQPVTPPPAPPAPRPPPGEFENPWK
jgi:hypothetical protein